MAKKIYKGLDPEIYNIVKSLITSFASAIGVKDCRDIEYDVLLDEMHTQTSIRRTDLGPVIKDVLAESTTSSGSSQGSSDAPLSLSPYTVSSGFRPGGDIKLTTPKDGTRASTGDIKLTTPKATVSTSTRAGTGDIKLAQVELMETKQISEDRSALRELEGKLKDTVNLLQSIHGTRATSRILETADTARATKDSLLESIKLKFETMKGNLDGQLTKAYGDKYKEDGPLSLFPSIGDEAASLEVTAPIISQIKTLEAMELALEIDKEKSSTTVAIHYSVWKDKEQFSPGECSLYFDSLLPARSGNIKLKFMKDAIDETGFKIFHNIESLTEGYFKEAKVLEIKSMNYTQITQGIQEVSAMEVQLMEVRKHKTVPVKTTSAGLLEYYKMREVVLGSPHKIQVKALAVEKFMTAAITENVYNIKIKPLKDQLAATAMSTEQRTALISVINQGINSQKLELAAKKVAYKDLTKPEISFGQVGESLEARKDICEREVAISSMEEFLGSFASETFQGILAAGDHHHPDSPSDSL